MTFKETYAKFCTKYEVKNVTHLLPPFCQLFGWLRSAILKMWLGPYYEILFSSKFISEMEKDDLFFLFKIGLRAIFWRKPKQHGILLSGKCLCPNL